MKHYDWKLQVIQTSFDQSEWITSEQSNYSEIINWDCLLAQQRQPNAFNYVSQTQRAFELRHTSASRLSVIDTYMMHEAF